jgi:hypothetical protein
MADMRKAGAIDRAGQEVDVATATPEKRRFEYTLRGVPRSTPDPVRACRQLAGLCDDRELEVWRQRLVWVKTLAEAGHGKPDDIAITGFALAAIDAEQRWRKREHLSAPGSYGRFDRAVIDRLKDAVDLPGLIESLGDPLRRTGRGHRGACPLHGGDNPSALSVDPARGLFHCHVCGAGGDAIDWLCDRWGCTFDEAVRLLARAAGVTLPEPPKRKKWTGATRIVGGKVVAI